MFVQAAILTWCICWLLKYMITQASREDQIRTESLVSPKDQYCLVSQEAILTETSNRYCMFPIEHEDLWRLYKQHVAGFWTPGEIDLSLDKKQWREMPEDEQHFIKIILGFFATADGIVSENLALNFLVEVQYTEARAFLAFQNAIEMIHNETYSILIDTLIRDKQERDDLFQGLSTLPSVQLKSEWALQWMSREQPFSVRLVAFACVEGIFFAGSFCSIFWLKTKGIMPGLTFSNELISRDESLHTLFACCLYKDHVLNKPTRDLVYKIVKSAVDIEEKFISCALPNDLVGMNSELMHEYIKYVADYLLGLLGYPPLYNVRRCPFQFMEMMSLHGKTNFFERRVSDYQKAPSLDNAMDYSFDDLIGTAF